jgi:hypothetical protein
VALMDVIHPSGHPVRDPSTLVPGTSQVQMRNLRTPLGTTVGGATSDLLESVGNSRKVTVPSG